MTERKPIRLDSSFVFAKSSGNHTSEPPKFLQAQVRRTVLLSNGETVEIATPVTLVTTSKPILLI